VYVPLNFAQSIQPIGNRSFCVTLHTYICIGIFTQKL